MIEKMEKSEKDKKMRGNNLKISTASERKGEGKLCMS